MDFRRLFGQSVHTGAFFVLGYASRLLLAIALGKALAVDQYGVYSLITAIFGLATSFLTLAVNQYYAREIPGIPVERAATLFKSIVVIQMAILAALIGAVMIVPWSREALAARLSLPGSSALLWVVAGLILADTLASDFSRFLLFRGEIERSNLVAFFQTAAWAFAAFALFCLPAHTVTLGALLGLWAASLVCALVYGSWRVGWGHLAAARVEPRLYLTALRFSLPLLCTALPSGVNWLGRFFLAEAHSTTVVGIFTFHANIILMISAIASPVIGTPLEPHIIQAYNTGQPQRSGYLLSASLRYRLILILPLLVVAALWSDQLIRLMARDEYLMAGPLLALLTPLPVLAALSSTFERVLFLERRTTTIAWCYVVIAAVQVGLYAVLTRWQPFLGAALAMEAGPAMLSVVFWALTRSAAVPVETRLIRAGLLAALCGAVAWAAAHLVPQAPRIVFLGAMTVVAGISSLVFAVMLRLILSSEFRRFRELLGGEVSR